MCGLLRFLGPAIAVSASGMVIPFRSFHLDFIDHLLDAIDSGYNFLGDLLFVEAEQPTSEEKNAVLALARKPTQYDAEQRSITGASAWR